MTAARLLRVPATRLEGRSQLMSEFRILRAVDYPECRGSGAGSTEIARDGGDGLDGFGWRLSIADVGESGGFSRFAGYQRIISVLEGGGMRLRWMARNPRRYARGRPSPFPATARCTAPCSMELSATST